MKCSFEGINPIEVAILKRTKHHFNIFQPSTSEKKKNDCLECINESITMVEMPSVSLPQEFSPCQRQVTLKESKICSFLSGESAEETSKKS